MNGKQHGMGKIILINGEVKRCVYADGKRVKWLDDDGESDKKIVIDGQNGAIVSP
jgi:hypothetical protein